MGRTKKWRIRHEIREGDDPRPVVTHFFWGDTQAEAQHVMNSHMKSDRFLKECSEKGLFSGNVPCNVEAFIEGPFK